MRPRFDRPADALAALGVVLLLAGVGFAATRGWRFGAKTAVAGGLGLAYLLTGVTVRDCPDAACRLRRALATVPVLGVLALAAILAGEYLAYGTVTPDRHAVSTAAAAAFLAFPIGLGYVVGSVDGDGDGDGVRRRALGLAGLSGLAGGVLTSNSILYFGRSPFDDLGIGVAAGLVLPLLGAVPAYFLARSG
ncbi:hypothetical protein [Halospeciosus flavus]|uniref:Uncharacterized protein n=1 Tax=Halospeciosus flavus TaxID=3032283 RepID=A0ABD5Z5F4_9EURY|nr:hypothetical protein [Halospeciosus flavus]